MGAGVAQWPMMHVSRVFAPQCTASDPAPLARPPPNLSHHASLVPILGLLFFAPQAGRGAAQWARSGEEAALSSVDGWRQGGNINPRRARSSLTRTHTQATHAELPRP